MSYSPSTHWQCLSNIFKRAIAIAIGQNVLVNSLLKEVPKYTDKVPPEAVVKAGALNLVNLTTSTSILTLLREAYGKAIQNLMFYSLVTACLALPFTLGMQWLKIKKVVQKVVVPEVTPVNQQSPSNKDLIAEA